MPEELADDIRNRMEAMVEAGDVERVGDRYRLTEIGQLRQLAIFFRVVESQAHEHLERLHSLIDFAQALITKTDQNPLLSPDELATELQGVITPPEPDETSAEHERKQARGYL